MDIRSKVFETVENVVNNDKRYNEYFIIVRGDGFYYVVGKDAITLRLILDLNSCKDMVSFASDKLDEILSKIVRNGFRVAIIPIK